MAIYYIDYNRGDDSNDGLSTGAPWKNLSKIDDGAASAGDQFLLADDSTWEPAITERVVPPTTWAGTSANPVIIGKYSPSSQYSGKPVVRWRHKTAASNWTETATANVWLYSNPGSYIFGNACLIRLGNTWSASCVDTQNSAALIGAAAVDGRYYATSTNLWLYSVGNPVDYYGGVTVSPSASGCFSLSSGRKWITIQDIHFEETGCGILLYSGNSTEVGFVAQRISGRTVSGLIAANGDSPGVLRAWVRDCAITDFGACALMAVAVNSFQQIEIYNNRIDDGVRCWAQGGIYLICRNTSGPGAKVYRNHLSRMLWGSLDKPVDGCGIYTETGSADVEVFANVVEDSYCAFQDNSGRRQFYTGNVARNVRVGMRITDQSNVNAMDHYSVNNTFLVGDEARGLGEFGSNQGQDYPGFWMYRPSGTVKVTAYGNLIAKIGAGRGRAAFGLPDAAGTFALDGNWVYGFDNDTLIASTNATPGSLTNAGEDDPRPYLGAGGALDVPVGTTLATLGTVNPLATAGTFRAGTKLMTGRMRPGVVPVGAYQAVIPNTVS